MADNILYTQGIGTTLAADDIGGVYHQRVKISVGADGAATDLSSANPLPVTAGTYSTKHIIAAASDNAQSVKAAAGTLRKVLGYNNAAYPVYLKFHNTAGTPTAGSGVVFVVAFQAGVAMDYDLGGRSFATGIGVTLVKDLADAGTTATAASDAVIEVIYE